MLAWFAWKKRWNVRATVIAVLVTSFVLNLLAHAQSLGAAAFYSSVARLWEIMIGGLLVHAGMSSQAREIDARSMLTRNALSFGGVTLLDNVRRAQARHAVARLVGNASSDRDSVYNRGGQGGVGQQVDSLQQRARVSLVW
ncbi:MAG: hypothetical protein ABJC63_08480 [Gemmatimonadales bacterium]